MNKKIVVIVVIVECIFAILLVSLLGAAIENAHKATKCRDIYFTDENYDKLRDDYVIVVDTKVSIGYQLYYVVSPDNTTDKSVSFSVSYAGYEEDPYKVLVSPTGYVTFVEDVEVVVTIKSMDGSERYDTVKLAPKISRGTVDDF